MKRNFADKTINVPQRIYDEFGQIVEPTIISQSEFNTLFSYDRSIGEGAYGTVKSVNNCYGETFAIKQSKDNQDTYGVLREAAVMKKFNHPNILKFIALYRIIQNKKTILLTEFCKFKSLKDFTTHLTSLPQQQKYRLVVEIFNGLNAMHEENMMHRDLKPQNVLIDEKKHVKLCDFGFCRYDQDLLKSRKVGTSLYNSPETDRGNYTKKCDVYSYGLVVYFVFSRGKNLFKKTETQQELKIQRQQHFKKGIHAYKDFSFPDDIIELLENTITEKEDKRWDSERVKRFWEKNLKQKDMMELLQNMQDSEMINKYEKKLMSQTQSEALKDNSTLSKQQKLASELIKRDIFSKDELQASKKLQCLLEKDKDISCLMKEFKKTVYEVNLQKIEKELITYGFLYQLELSLQQILTECNKLSSQEKDWSNPNFQECLQSLFDAIIQQKKQLCTVIVKIGNYLQRIRYLLKPTQLLSPISKSFDEIKKLSAYLREVCGQGGIAHFKTVEEIQIENRYKPQIDSVAFSKGFSGVLSRYRKALAQDKKQQQRQKLSLVFNKLNEII